MALNIKDRRTDELAREVAMLSDKSITEALRETLELRVVELKAVEARRQKVLMDKIRDIQAFVAAAPIFDDRSTAEITDELDEDILASH